MSSTIIEKINKLLALAGNNPNEAEAARAMEMASSLMMRHGIEEAQLGKKEVKIGEGAIFPDIPTYHKTVGNAASKLSGTQSVLYRGKKESMVFVGRPENVMIGEQLYTFIVLQIEMLYKEALALNRGMDQKGRAAFRQSFKEACALKVLTRVKQIIADQGLEGVSDSRALVVNHRAQLDSEIGAYFSERGVKTLKPRTIKYKDHSASAQGWSAGDRVEINKGVN